MLSNKKGLNENDLKAFNYGDMEEADFMDGDFGVIDVGEDFGAGEEVCVMAKGTVEN